MNRALTVGVVVPILFVQSRAAEALDKKQTELLGTITCVDTQIFERGIPVRFRAC